MACMDVTFDVLNSGTEIKEVHVSNMLTIPVTLVVLNNGTVLRELHPLNIFDIDVTFPVSSNGTSTNLLQSWNMNCVDVALAVLNRGIAVSWLQLANILVIPVTLDVSNKGTLRRDEQPLNIDPAFNSAADVVIFEISTKEVQLENALLKFVHDVKSNAGTSTKEWQSANIKEPLVQADVLNKGTSVSA